MKRRPERKRLRLAGYDYASPGAYFVTTVTNNRRPLFGRVVRGHMRLNAFGRIVQQAWDDLPNHYPHLRLDAFVVMPDHVHGILVLVAEEEIIEKINVVGDGLRPRR